MEIQDVDDLTPLGMGMELSNNSDLDDAMVEDSFEPDVDDFTLPAILEERFPCIIL